MSSPDSHDIVVALDALRADAGLWQGNADAVRAAAGAARAQALGAAAFSFAGGQVAAGYHDVQDRLVRLLDGAVGNFERVAQALLAAADSYEREEQAGVHRLRNIY